MPNDLNPIEATSGMKTRKKSSAAVKLLQVAALAAVMVPFGSAVAEAGSILFSSGSPSGTYTFGSENEPFDFILTFTGIPQNDSFSVDVEANVLSELDPPVPAGSVCIPIDGSGDCIDFTATTTAVAPTDFTSYVATIDWTFDTNSNFPNTGNQRVELLESHAGGPFTDITIPGSYCAVLPCGDPGISGQSDSFSQYTVVDATVPEPATLALLGSGLAGLLMRSRRRSRPS
jgi:hypothetical protein